MAGGFAGSANSARGRFLQVYRCNSPLSCACWQEKNGLLEAPEAKSFQFLCRTPPSVARWLALTPQTQCSETSGWCRSSDCARLPNARGSGNIGLAHALPRDLHTVPVPHSLYTGAPSGQCQHIPRRTSVRSPTAAGGGVAATLPVPSPARPRPVPRAHCAKLWSLSASTTPQ